MKKNTNRKIFAATASAALVASAVVPASVLAAETEIETGFPDVSSTHEAANAVKGLAEAGIIEGYEDGNFKPGNLVTRSEVAKMVASILKLDTNAPNTDFPDVKEDVWYTDSINALFAADYINGYDNGTFAPGDQMTRAEFAKLVVEAYGIPLETADLPFTDLKEDVWYSPYIETLYANELIKGQTATTFGPGESIKRIDLALLLANTDYKFGDTLTKPEVEASEPAVDSVSAITNADNTATVSGKVTDAEEVEIVLTSFETGRSTTHTAEVNNGEYTFTTDALSPSRYSVDVTAIAGNERSESSRADFVIIAADTGFSGFVTDSANDNGINGVTVEVDGKTTTTDTTGFYLIEGVSTDKYHDVTFSNAGLVTKVEADNRVRDGRATVVNTTMTLLASSNIEISSTAVNAATGAALTGAKVTLFAKDSYLDDWFEIADTVVNSDGDFDFIQTDIDPDYALDLGGEYKVVVENGSVDENNLYNTVEREITLATDDVENVLDGFALSAVKALDITGKVVSNEANLGGATVSLLDADGNQLAEATTETDGTYAVKTDDESKLRLPTGKYFLEIENESITTIEAIEVTEGQAVEQNFDLATQGAVFEFKLGATTPEQLSDGDYNFDLYTKDGGHIETVEEVVAFEDSEIAVVFAEEVPAGEYFVRVTSDFAVTTDYDVTITDGEVTGFNNTTPPVTPVKGGDVVKGATVAGSVAGAPNPNVQVQLVNSDGEVVDGTNPDASGAYSFDGIPAGEYTVNAFKYGFIADSGNFSIELNSNNEAVAIDATDFTSLDLELKAIPTTGVLKGNVRQAGSLVSVGTDVTASLYNALGSLVNQQDTVAGSYDFAGVAPGVYTLVLRGDNYETTAIEEVVVSAGGTKTENITVETNPLAGIELTFVDPNNKEIDTGYFNVTLADEYADLNGSIADAGIDSTNVNPVAFDSLSAGTFTYYFTSSDYQNFSSTITLSDREDYKAVVALTDAGITYEVEINAVDNDNSTVASTTAIVVDSNNNRVGGPVALGGDGKATFNLANGDYKVLVYADNHFVGTQEFTVDRANMTTDTIRLVEFK